MIPPRRVLVWTLVALAPAAGLAACTAEDVTGEPEDIGQLVHVVAEGSSCALDRDADEATFRVRLRNTGEDERTVSVTPRLRDASGEGRGDSLDSFEITVPGDGEAEGEGVMERAPADLAACLIRIDSGEEIRIARTPD